MNKPTVSGAVFLSDKTALIILILLAFLFPTSVGGRQVEIIWGVVNALAIGAVCVALASRYGFDCRVLVFAFVLLVALSISSLIVLLHNDGSLSVARFAPSFLVSIVFSLHVGKIQLPRETVIKFIDIFSIAIIVWNFLTLVRFDPLIQFVENYYIQLDDYTATEYSLISGKPVFTFGIHNFASFFYLFMYYCTLKVYLQENSKRMLLYAVAFIIFTLLLVSTAAYGTAAIMIAVFTYEFWYRKSISIKWLIVLLAPIIIALILLNPTTIERLLLSDNGFIARYASNDLYAGNSAFLKEYPLGAGFTIPSSGQVYFADSGFWIYLTMGNVALLCGLFAFFFLYVKQNVHDKDDRMLLIVSYLIAELSFSSFLYWKTIAFLVISVVVLNALSRETNSKDSVSLTAYRG